MRTDVRPRLSFPFPAHRGTFSEMRAVVQRVLSAEVRVADEIVGACGVGLCVFAAVHREDTETCAQRLAQKLLGLRIFSDPEGKMNLSLQQLNPSGELLVVSNFTLYGDTSKSRRPSFSESASFEQGRRLFEVFVDSLTASGTRVSQGVFGADMAVTIVNDGPVTLILDS